MNATASKTGKSATKIAVITAICGAIIALVACAENTWQTPPFSAVRPVPIPVRSRLPAIDYTIQVGAFSSPKRASAYANSLVKKGIDAYYFIANDRLWKVRFERFGDKKSARKRALALQQRRVIDAFYIARPFQEVTGKDPAGTLRQNLTATARRFIGSPYRWGGASAETGFDCSGLTMTVYRLNGLELPRSAKDQYYAGDPVSRDAVQKGDLLFFATGWGDRITHVGLYMGEGNFIHAPGRGKSIRLVALSNSYFRNHFRGARRYF
jgi:cell wall-associated NlpC family hydrolase